MPVKSENVIRAQPAPDQSACIISETSLMQRDGHNVLENERLHRGALSNNSKSTRYLIILVLEGNPAPSVARRGQSSQHSTHTLPSAPSPTEAKYFGKAEGPAFNEVGRSVKRRDETLNTAANAFFECALARGHFLQQLRVAHRRQVAVSHGMRCDLVSCLMNLPDLFLTMIPLFPRKSCLTDDAKSDLHVMIAQHF